MKKRVLSKRILSKRIRDSLIWVAEQYAVNLHHFIEVLNNHPDTTKPVTYDAGRMCVARLRQQGYVETKRIVSSLPNFIYLTRKAINDLDLPFADYEPRDYEALPNGRKLGATIWHKNHINSVRLHLEKQYGSQLGWLSERRLLLNQRPHADGSYDHRVDALAFIDDKDTALEIENTDKGQDRLESILLDLMTTYDQTYYYCTNPGTYGLVKRVARDIDPNWQHFRVMDWSVITDSVIDAAINVSRQFPARMNSSGISS